VRAAVKPPELIMNSNGECLVFIAGVKTITYIMTLETLLPFKDAIKNKKKML
jgi:hypothetical protein